MIELDNEQSKIYEYITAKKKNVFIQGQAGTGKSTLINYIKDNSEKNIVLASPTALAATTIGGSTLHSLFRLPPKDYFDPVKTIKERNKTNDIVLKHIDILIIDEIQESSMVYNSIRALQGELNCHVAVKENLNFIF